MERPKSVVTSRAQHWESMANGRFDVAIVGGGITGGSLYDALCRGGWRTLLLDRQDFAGATSQASGMMIWGGLLYLRQFDLATVIRLSRSRDRLLREVAGQARPCSMRYIPAPGSAASRLVLGTGLAAYWLISGGRRRPPGREKEFGEQGLITPGLHGGAFRFDEGVLRESDARFVLSWITPHAPPRGVALNHCEVAGGAFDPAGGVWRLELADRLSGAQGEARARVVINCAGPWTDRLNEKFGIESPYKHVLSKGVYLGLAREETHELPLIFDLGEHEDVVTWVPWGPVALWGPTETALSQLELGMRPEPEDVRFLLRHANRHLRRAVEPGDVISLRCGVRALAVARGYSAERYTLELSRRSLAHADRQRPWISVYGGKLTDCRERAALIRRAIAGRLGAGAHTPERGNGAGSNGAAAAPEMWNFPGLAGPVPSPRWCRDHEFCCGLEDYLRRRTNIAQWTARGGLGGHDEHRAAIEDLARQFEASSGVDAAAAAARYRAQVAEDFDGVLEKV